MNTPRARPLCIVPARGGSKRFPGKNITGFGGKPLIAWTIEPALESGVFDDVWVSSEDDEILDVARQYGAAPLPRKASLAGDDITVAQLCRELLDEFAGNGKPFDAVYVLLPTSPFRQPDTIRRAWATFVAGDAGALLSVVVLEHPPAWALTLDGAILQPAVADEYAKPRGALQPCYRHDGAHAIARADYLRLHGDFLGLGTIALMSDELESVDINERIDLEWAEFLRTRRGAVC